MSTSWWEGIALTHLVEKQIKQQLTGQDLASAVHGWSSALISRHFAVKRYTRDEDDGEEDAFAGMEGDDGKLEETVFHFHDCWKTYNVSSSFTLHTYVLPHCGVYLRAGFISLSTSNCVAFVTSIPFHSSPDFRNQDPRDMLHKGVNTQDKPEERLPIMHIKVTHNNTMFTITDQDGKVLAWTSAVSVCSCKHLCSNTCV